MALDENTQKAIGRVEANREDSMGRVTAVLVEVGRHYKERDLAIPDIHMSCLMTYHHSNNLLIIKTLC